MFFSIIFGLACGGMIISILGLINPSWVGADDREIIYESVKGWFIIFFIVSFFYNADSFNEIAWFVAIVMGVGIDYFIRVEIYD